MKEGSKKEQARDKKAGAKEMKNEKKEYIKKGVKDAAKRAFGGFIVKKAFGKKK